MAFHPPLFDPEPNHLALSEGGTAAVHPKTAHQHGANAVCLVRADYCCLGMNCWQNITKKDLGWRRLKNQTEKKLFN